MKVKYAGRLQVKCAAFALPKPFVLSDLSQQVLQGVERLFSGVLHSLVPGASRAQFDGRHEPGRAAMLRRLLECESYSYERRLAPRFSEERNPDWQAEDEACRNVEVRIARDRRRSRTSSTEMIAVNQVRRPCRPARGAHQRTQAVLAHHSVDTFRSRHPVVLRKRRKVSLAGKGSFRFRLDEQLLAEVG